MRLSVALCTYNGGTFLPAQLASLASQTRPPDELVVCDDRSSDDTLTILDQFAATAPFPVRHSVNPVNLGSTKNFDRAVSLCGGDLIALCDQDDVWHSDKLEVMERAFRVDPRVVLAASDAKLIDAADAAIGSGLWNAIGLGPPVQRAFREGRALTVLLRGNCLTGATIIVRSRLAKLARPFPSGWVHDEWLAFLGAMVGPIHLVRRQLISYRLHPGQQLGLRELTDAAPLDPVESNRRLIGQLARQGERLQDIGPRIAALHSELKYPSILRWVRAAAKHYLARARSRDTSRWPRLMAILREVVSLGYARFGAGRLGIHDVASDLLAPNVTGTLGR